MRFQDIKQLTRGANYQVDVPWKLLESQLTEYNMGNVLELDPEFQRAHVWTEKQQMRYVEFILRGGQSSKSLYWNQADFNGAGKAPMFLVDGKQRLEAVRKFLRGDLQIFGGARLSDFEDRLPHQASFRFHVNELPTYRNVLEWYIDLNAGGIAHTEDEIERVRELVWKHLPPENRYRKYDPDYTAND